MPTLLKPEDVAKLDLASYKKALEKDFARNGRNQKWEDFVFITDYKMGAKKVALFLLASATDKTWADTVKAAKTNGKKYTTGICKIAIVADQDGNGKDDIQITIKEAKGDLNKKKVAENIKSELFADDVDVQTLVLADDEEDVAHVHFEEAPHSPEVATETLDHAQQELAARKKLDSFMQAFQEFMSKIGSARLLQEATQEKLRILVEHKDTPNILTEANKAAHEIKLQIVDFDEIIAIGETWFAEHKDKVKALLGVQGYKEKMESAKERIINLKRLQRFLTQSEDYINEKYLHDFDSNEAQDIQKKQELADVTFHNLRQSAEQYKTQFKAKEKPAIILASIDTVILRRDEYAEFADSLKTAQQIKFVADVEKFLMGSRAIVEVALMSSIPELKDLEDKYKNFRGLPEPHNLEECRIRIEILNTFVDALVPILATHGATVGALYGSFTAEINSIRKLVNRKFANDKIEVLRQRAVDRGGATVENLYDVFMEEFRGNVTYMPEPGGNIFAGSSRANCQDICTSLGRLFTAAGFANDTGVVLAKYYLTAPVDATWLDPNSPGNTNIEGKPAERRYFFSEHWVVEADGKRFCPTTGRKLGDIESTIAVRIGADQKDLFENEVCKFEKAAKPADNRGFTYKVTFK
jgi:hypothetical protein